MLRRRFKRRGASEEEAKADINMNSLIDLTFLLLVTFIITMPQIEQGVSVILPQAKADKLPDKKSKSCSVTIDAMGKIFLEKQEITLDALKEALTAIQKEDPDAAVLIRGDERQDYGRIMDVVKTVHGCKIHRLSLVTAGE